MTTPSLDIKSFLDQDQQKGLAPGLFCDRVNEAAGYKENQAAENNRRDLHPILSWVLIYIFLDRQTPCKDVASS